VARFSYSNSFDEVAKKLERKVRSIEGDVPFTDLFTASFMSRYTSYGSFKEFMNASGFPASTQEEFDAIPDDEFDQFVAASTKFKSWKDMLYKAGELYVEKKLKDI
jgi:hypothetical protein